MTVQKMPEGYHSVTPSLIVEGCNEAIIFYQKAFNATEKMRLTMPNGSIGHAEIVIGNSVVMLAEACPEWNTKSPHTYGGSPASLFVYVDDVDATVAQAVGAGATIQMPVVDMFWGDRCGKVLCPFGHLWMVATHIEDVSPADVAERMKTHQP
jgi:PhnB protein